MSGDLGEKVAELARAAAIADYAEGGTRIGQNCVSLLAWGFRTRLDHASCGALSIEKDEDGNVAAAHCPSHGRLPAPEWKAAS